MTTFADLGVPAAIARRLDERGIDEPFDIQAATIPDALAGRDLCGKAPTGSGKTIAFGIPMAALVKRASPKRPKGLVLVPTRELANQVADELMLLGDQRVLAVYGGAGIEPQLKKLRAGVDIVVACPGRLKDVIERKACDLRDVSFVVIDEADRMADMGFLPEVRRLLDQTPRSRQTLLFSATLDGVVDTLVKSYQKDPAVHTVAEEKQGDVTHRFWLCERKDRAQLTAEVIERAGPTVVFSRTRHGADRIARQLEKLGVSAAAIHGNRSQGQRERALAAFHRGEVKALVATDVAARGIHVEGVACVVHFDLPADHKDYVHRSGRTGRAGRDGTVVALLGAEQRRDANRLARAAGLDVEIVEPDVNALPPGYGAFREASKRRRPDRRADASPEPGRANGRRPKPGTPRSGGPKGGGSRNGAPTSGGPKRGGGGAKTGTAKTDGTKPARPTSRGAKHGGPKRTSADHGGGRPAVGKPGGRRPKPKAKAGGSTRSGRPSKARRG